MTSSQACKRRFSLLMAISAAAFVIGPMAAQAQEKIFETNVTNDLNLSSGEPEIAVDPINPRHLAIIEFAVGSARKPAFTFNANDLAQFGADLPGAFGNSGRVMISTDGGDHWSIRPPPVAYGPPGSRFGGGDPYIAYGPHGEIYAGSEVGAPPKDMTDALSAMSTSAIAIAVSLDGGRTFEPQQAAGTPIDRPWLAADLSTGMLYSVSTGPLDVATGKHNIPGPTAPNDRWLVAWQPRLAAKSEPRRIGGPDFSGAGGSTIAAANGVVAAAFVLGGPRPGMGAMGAPKGPSPVPASLQSVVSGAVASCSMQAPCLFFETSADQGRTWTRHFVATPGGFDPHRANLSADAGKPGRYAISVLNPAKTGFEVFVTDDAGRSWAPPTTVNETAPGEDFKQWMAYGPTGVLGLVWKKERDDFGPPPAQPKGAPREVKGPGFDVYSAISCDGGADWSPPLRVNAVVSPPGGAGSDDMTYIALDAHYAHMVWGDRRHAADVHNATDAAGGLQAYYGRVPFTMVAKGASCGRRS